MNAEKMKKEVTEYYESLAQLHDTKYDNPTMKYMRSIEIGVVERHLVRKMKILDVGCGTGIHSLTLAMKGHTVTGVDIATRMIDVAREKIKKANLESNANFYVADVEKKSEMQKLDEKYDIAISMFGTFNHLTNINAALENVRALLTESGIFIFTIANYWSIFRILNLVKKDTTGNRNNFHLPKISELYVKEVRKRLWTCFYSKDEISSLLKQNGFVIENVGGIFFFVRPYYHYTEKDIDKAIDQNMVKMEDDLRWQWPVNELSEYLIVVCRKVGK